MTSRILVTVFRIESSAGRPSIAFAGKFGFPDTIRVEQDSEFISRDMDLWAYQRGVALDLSGPGKPAGHAFIEAFNGQFRAECLYRHWFMSLEDAVQKLEAWRRHY